MATFSNNQTIAISSAVAQSLGTFTVPVDSYFQGQAACSTGTQSVSVGGVLAALLIAGSVGGAQAPITAGPGAVITATSTAVTLSGCLFVNTP